MAVLYSGLESVCDGKESMFFTSNSQQKAEVILLHGFRSSTSHSSTIKGLCDVIMDLSGGHVKWVAVDYYAHGHSSGDFDTSFSVTKAVEGVMSFMEKRCTYNCRIFGNSLGGLIAAIISSKNNNYAVCMAPPIYCLAPEFDSSSRDVNSAFPRSLIDDVALLSSTYSKSKADLSNSVFIFGMSDEVVLYEQNTKVASDYDKPPRIVVMPNVAHSSHSASTLKRIAAILTKDAPMAFK